MSQDFQQNPSGELPVSPSGSQIPVSPSTEEPKEPLSAPKTSSPMPPWMNPKEKEPDIQTKAETQATSSNPVSSDDVGQEIKESIFKKLIPLAGILIFILLIIFLIFKVILPLVKKTKNKIPGLKTGSKNQVVLTYWGLWEPENVMSSLISEYKKNHPEVTINYLKQSHKDYRERLQSALAQGTGPDIFRLHNTWLAMLKKDLAPMPEKISQSLNLSQNYYPVVNDDLKIGGQFLAVPLEFDGLSLFYNTKIFDEAGKLPPDSWDKLRQTALDLTVKDETGKIKIAGVALGTTNNVDNFSDILGLMMLQNGANLSQPTGSLAEDALKFYTLFSTVDKVWNQTLPASSYAFAMEKVAMIFAPSWRIYEIKQINPQLKFKTVPVPQLPETKVSWASFWVEGVALKSKNSQAAWDFLSYLSSKEALTKFYDNAAQVRGFGEPYPRIDMASLLENDPLVGSFVKQGSYAKSWYLCSQTHDNGINDKMIKYFEDAVNANLNNQTATNSLTTASQGVAQVLKQYGIK